MIQIEICLSSVFLSVVLNVKGKGWQPLSPFNSSILKAYRNGDHLPPYCGYNRYQNTDIRIINGREAALGQFPFMARVGFRNKKQDAIMFDCGGSLVNMYYVLSAAHCNPSDNIVRLGENYVDENPDCFGRCAPPVQDIEIKSKINPDFCREEMIRDISLIELKDPVRFNEFVQPICLPNRKMEYYELLYQHVFVIGWGLINVDPWILADRLMYIRVPVVNMDVCSMLYSHEIKESQLCIGNPGAKDSCGGDSGGPVIMTSRNAYGRYRAYLVGIVSYGLPNCGRGPGVYTDVSYFLDWILQHIRRG